MDSLGETEVATPNGKDASHVLSEFTHRSVQSSLVFCSLRTSVSIWSARAVTAADPGVTAKESLICFTAPVFRAPHAAAANLVWTCDVRSAVTAGIVRRRHARAAAASAHRTASGTARRETWFAYAVPLLALRNGRVASGVTRATMSRVST